MSGALEALQKKIHSGEDLASIVRTMKALAATNVRTYEKAVESLDDYYRTVEMGLSVVLSDRGENLLSTRIDSSSPVLIVIFGSDHGLAGRFNESIVSYALQEYGEDEESWPPHPRLTVCVGEQAFARTDAAREKVEDVSDVPLSMSGITTAVLALLEKIEDWRKYRGVQRVLLFYNRPLSAAGFGSHAETLLPVDLTSLRRKRQETTSDSRSLSTFTMPAPRLLSALLRQYFFVSLYRAYALSLAAENAARLAAMQAAEKNIQERLDELKASFQQERQAAITEELLDIVSGFKALRRGTSPEPITMPDLSSL